MSTPKRYRHEAQEVCDGLGNVISVGVVSLEHPFGGFVRWEDYAALVQQGIRDHGDWRSKLNFLETDYKAEVARLTAENERLRKAGDAMYHTAQQDGTGLWLHKSFQDWNAAKEGRDAK